MINKHKRRSAAAQEGKAPKKLSDGTRTLTDGTHHARAERTAPPGQARGWALLPVIDLINHALDANVELVHAADAAGAGAGDVG